MNYEALKVLLSSKSVAALVGADTICTPFDLIDEILDKLPKEIWSNPNIKVLDPACGRGAFLVAMKNRFLSAGIDEGHIVRNMLHGVDIDPRDVQVAQVALDPDSKYDVNKNVVCDDSLTRNWGKMKFDVVVGNPPYQSEQLNSRTRLWMQFVDLAFDLLNDGGWVAVVTPTSWSHNQSLYSKWFNNHEVLHINIDECSKHFPGVGSTFSWYIIKNSPNVGGMTTVHTSTNCIKVPLPASAFGSHPQAGGLLDKFLKSTHPRLNAYSRSSHHTSKNYGKFSATPHKDFPIQVIHSLSTSNINYGWGKVHDPEMDGPRVICFNMINGWLEGSGFRVVDGAQTTESVLHLPADSITEATNLLKYIQSRPIRFVVKSLNSNRTVRAESLRCLPRVDLSRSWTDRELYDHFKLTPEEIKLIEDTVK